jgi:hypothetical protein
MAPRSARQRITDTLHKLATEVDCWVASADGGGEAYLIPLSFYWDGASLILATPSASRTARNLRRAGVARVGLGPTRDVVIVEGPVSALSTGEIDPALGDAHAAHTGFDPRTLSDPYVYFQVTPRTIQAWREADELAGRTIMRDGRWVID